MKRFAIVLLCITSPVLAAPKKKNEHAPSARRRKRSILDYRRWSKTR